MFSLITSIRPFPGRIFRNCRHANNPREAFCRSPICGCGGARDWRVIMWKTSSPVRSSADWRHLIIRAVWQRVKARWQQKAWLTAVLTFVFVPLYLLLSHRVWRPLWNPPLTWFDRHIAFQPGWVWPYQSLYLITGTIPWLATTGSQLGRYVVSFWLVAIVGLATFVILPVAAPRPQVATHSTGMSILLSYDGPYGDSNT